jgi:hypothetical protein
MSEYVQFTEVNENEGETWHFWLQVNSNNAELGKLRGLLAAVQENAEEDAVYVLTENVEPESVVDKLVRYADEGYMPSHIKVSGVFTCPESLGEYGDGLYKGRIADYFTREERSQ